MPVLSLILHRLSCVQARPPPGAWLVCELALQMAWEHRFDGLTYGAAKHLEASASAYVSMRNERPPAGLQASADATWGAGLEDDGRELPSLVDLSEKDAEGRQLVARDLYSVLITFAGAAVHHTLHKIGCITDSSMGNEGIASAKAAELLVAAVNSARGFGKAPQGPVVLGTDNKANLQVASRTGTSRRSKHLLRRYYVLMQRIADGEVRLVHVPDDENPSDFLTKWVPAAKLRASLRYATGAAAQ